jgi:hypothetical protein
VDVSRSRQTVNDLVEQFSDTHAVLGGDFEHWIESELMEVHDPGAGTPVVGLVHRQERRRVGLAHDARNFPIAGDHALAAIHDEHKEICVSDRPTAALEHELVQRILAGAKHPTGVGDFEGGPLPFGGVCDDVAGRSGNRGDDRPPSTGQTVKKRGFPDIRPSDQDDRGNGLHGILTA